MSPRSTTRWAQSTIGKIVAAVLCIAVSLATFTYWLGSLLTLTVFHLAMVGMLALAFVGPFSYAYGFLTVLLFLGFWSKLVAHILTGMTFVEPIGTFDASARSWDIAISAASAVAIGVCIARILQLWSDRLGASTLVDAKSAPPSFYHSLRGWLWITTACAVIALNLWNASAAFYQIGVNPRLVLPVRLNVPLAWLINWGFALWISCLVHWELQLRPVSSPGVLFCAILEALAASLSTLSRSAYLFHALPSLLAWVVQHGGKTSRRRIVKVFFVFLVGLSISLITVQTQRTKSYFGSASTSAPTTAAVSERQPGMFRQIYFLFLHRWVGLEGMLAVTAYPGKDMSLFKEGIFENPKLGTHTLYQRIAEARYNVSSDFTFLTLAGAGAVLFYSGSVAVVVAGMVVLTMLLLITEVLIRRTTGNSYLAAAAGIAMAYTVTQLTFPYLALVFFIELWCTLGAIVLLEHWDSHTKRFSA